MQRRYEAEPEVWFVYARRDLGDGTLLLGAGSAHSACWHAQQAAEKAIKGVLRARGQVFPYSQDLDVLKRLLTPPRLPAALTPLLPQHTMWASTTRYPGVWPDPTKADADDAIAHAGAIVAAATALVEALP